jgi:hypothetical protein
MRKVLLCVWQFPQVLLAGVLWMVFKVSGRLVHKSKGGLAAVFWVKCAGFGVSLGPFIFLDGGYSKIDVRHELGHSRQSLLLGPLYLFVAGIPSAVFNNLWDRVFHKKWDVERRHRWYYSRYPERWADSLGGVKRSS